ncbi:MAG: hypothetical protein AAFR81_00835 [Chloroflexota bacterium]
MNVAGKQLKQLQETDLALRDDRQRVSEIEQALHNDSAVVAAQKAVEDAEGHLTPKQTQLRDLELQVQTTEQKRESSQQRLYSGTVSNPKELQDIEKNIASLKKRQTSLEDTMLALMVEIENAMAVLESAQATLNSTRTESRVNNKALVEEKDQLESKMTDLHTLRATLTTSLDDDLVALYEQLRPKMAQRPIAILTDDATCSICGVRQTNTHAQDIRRGDAFLRCANCNRIILAD